MGGGAVSAGGGVGSGVAEATGWGSTAGLDTTVVSGSKSSDAAEKRLEEPPMDAKRPERDRGSRSLRLGIRPRPSARPRKANGSSAPANKTNQTAAKPR